MNSYLLSIYVGIIFTLGIHTCSAKQYVTSPERADGFGAQFQTIIYSAIYAELNNLEFVYTPFKNMEHNYDNDSEFILKKENLINFINNFEINDHNARRLGVHEVIQFFEINLNNCVKSAALGTIKKIFRSNKNRADYFDDEHFHIVVHVRRPNSHDCRLNGADTPDTTFLSIINKLRNIYASINPLFHLQSQGNLASFSAFLAPDVILHLNESIEDSFNSMVLADALVTSRSSFSYTAGILSDSLVYYIPFWHPPLPGWISINTLT